MTSLLNSIMIGFNNFPFFAVLLTIPMLLIQFIHYRKINLVRTGISYVTLLYALCFMSLVFLPLPTLTDAAKLSTHDIQFIPFHFIADIVRESSFRLNDIHTYLPSFFDRAVLQVVFNVLLVVPFGMILRYCFHMNTKKIVLLSFALSLFVEIAQLTGLFFVFNGSYRLCDIDDLMANTLGGFLGCQIVKSLEAYIPAIEKFDLIFKAPKATVSQKLSLR